jgi:hypothetical protein
MKKAVFWDVVPCRGTWEERITSIFKVEERRIKSASEGPVWAGR